MRGIAELPVGTTIENLDNIALTEVSGFKPLALPWYSDETPPV